MHNQQPFPNELDAYRRRMMLTTKHVAHLLGHRETSTFRGYERGERLPSLMNAFRLGIILRVPLEFLFPALYDELKRQIRAEEQRLAMPLQQRLF